MKDHVKNYQQWFGVLSFRCTSEYKLLRMPGKRPLKNKYQANQTNLDIIGGEVVERPMGVIKRLGLGLELSRCLLVFLVVRRDDVTELFNFKVTTEGYRIEPEAKSAISSVRVK